MLKKQAVLRSRVALALTLCFTALAGAGHAYASLLGSSVTSQYYAYNGTYSAAGSPAAFTANGTVQETFCSGCPEGFNLTVSANQVKYEFFGTGGYWDSFGAALNSGGLYIDNGNLLTFLGVTLSSVTLDSASNVAGITSSKLTYNASNIALNWAGISGIAPGQTIILDVVTATATPEPAEWLLTLTAFACITVWRRRSDAGRNAF